MLNILFVIDDIEHKYFEFNDLVTNFWFIKELLERNHNVDICVKNNLYLDGDVAYSRVQKSYLCEENGIAYYKDFYTNKINDYDVVFFRPDPPVNENYLNACTVFDFVDKEKTFVINDPSKIKNFGEKSHCAKFPQCCVKSIITASKEVIEKFVEEHRQAVIKPLNMCFGQGVYFLDKNDKNFSSLIKTATNNFTTHIVLQEYLPEVKNGDKRVLIINGEVLDECIVKLAGDNDFKFNTHADKYFKSSKLTPLEKQRAKIIAETLKTEGFYLIGLDMINELVTEINITSPCYFIREINQNNNIEFQNIIMEKIEKLIDEKLLLKTC